MTQWVDLSKEGWDAVVAFYVLLYTADQSLFALMAAATTIFVGVPILLVLRMMLRWLRQADVKKMGKKEMHRQKKSEIDSRIREKVADILTDFLEDARHADQLTRREVSKLYRQYATRFGLWDLIPPDPVEKTPYAYELKERIRARLGFKDGDKLRLRYNKPEVNEDAFEEELKKA